MLPTGLFVQAFGADSQNICSGHCQLLRRSPWYRLGHQMTKSTISLGGLGFIFCFPNLPYFSSFYYINVS